MLSSTITAVSVAITLFHFGLWRCLPFFLAPKPDLNGTWKVTATTWPGGKGNTETFTGFMVVKQRYFSLSMRLETELTSSELVAEKITKTKGGLCQLWAIYYCEPRPGIDPSRVRPHYGAMMLQIVREVNSDYRIEGRYWIEGELFDGVGARLKDGRIELHDRRWEYYQDYDAAGKGFQHPKA